MDALKRNEFFINQINQVIKLERGGDPTAEVYLRWDDQTEIVWTRNWGETLYDLAGKYGEVWFDDVDINDPLEVLDAVETTVHSFEWYTAEELEGYFRRETEAICGVVSICGYNINAMEALRNTDYDAWRETFLGWLNDGDMDVSSYEFVGE